MQSIVREANPEALARAGVRLIIIGNGSPSMAKAYRRDVFRCPYALYTDPSLRLYNALGMNLKTFDAGAEEEKGDYIVHGPMGGVGMVLKNAMKMPIGKAGDMKQLGGEFVMGPGYAFSFRSFNILEC